MRADEDRESGARQRPEPQAGEGRVGREQGPVSDGPRKLHGIGPVCCRRSSRAASRNNRDYQEKCKVLHGDSRAEVRRSPTVGDLGKNLRAARESLKLTQEDVSDRSGVQAGEISRIERGMRDPKVSTLEKIAAAVGMSPGRLLDGDDQR